MNRKRSCGHCENVEDPKGKTTGSRNHVPPAKRWEILARALRDRGYAIIPEGGGQKIVRIRPRKKGAGSPEMSGGKGGAKAPKTDPEEMNDSPPLSIGKINGPKNAKRTPWEGIIGRGGPEGRQGGFMNNPSLVPVPFHATTLYLVDLDGVPYVPLKPVIEGMGLNWSLRRRNLSLDSHRWGLVSLEVRIDAFSRSMLSIPLANFQKWIMTIDLDRPDRIDPRLN